MKKKIVFLTGAGVSAESGIQTFRDNGGLWEGHDVKKVASIEGWRENRELVLEFYNGRRRQLDTVEPNAAHKAIASLEEDFNVVVVTQNVDDLHERGGSTKVIHLHGELKKACSSMNKQKTVPYENDIKVGDKHEDGSQLRPFIVWFGEDVPLIDDAIREIRTADILVIAGTSLEVYPAAGLMGYAKASCDLYLIDPSPRANPALQYFRVIKKNCHRGHGRAQRASRQSKMKDEILYFFDRARHLVCLPYSVENLHAMAESLNIKRCWFHGGKHPHYDIPKKRIEEIAEKCIEVSPRQIAAIVHLSEDPEFREIILKQIENVKRAESGPVRTSEHRDGDQQPS